MPHGSPYFRSILFNPGKDSIAFSYKKYIRSSRNNSMNFQRTGSVSQTRTQNDLYRATGGTVRKAFLESIRFVISFRSANLSEKSIICCLWLELEYLCWQNVWQISQAFDVGVYIKLLCYTSKNSLRNVFLFHSRPSFFPREFRH